MKTRLASLFASVLILSGCEEKKEITVTETRPATTRDGAPKLFATSDERFPQPTPAPAATPASVKAETPDGWSELPASQFRLLNYRFGESGTGEVWVSIAQGSVLDNVNRWLGQFGTAALDEAGLAALPAVLVAGATGKWVTAEGEYAAGMGAPPKPGFALAGVIASVGGQILTVKMVGPKDDVLAARPDLEIFVKSVGLAE